MKPHPRIRKTIKWGGAAVTVLLVVVWIGSGTVFSLSWIGTSGYGVDLAGGRLVLHDYGFVFPSKWTGFEGHWNSPANQLFLWFLVVQQAGHQAIAVPLWVLAMGTWAATASIQRLDTLARRRAKLNLCPKCGYDRTGIAQDAKCPECGSGGAVPASV